MTINDVTTIWRPTTTSSASSSSAIPTRSTTSCGARARSPTATATGVRGSRRPTRTSTTSPTTSTTSARARCRCSRRPSAPRRRLRAGRRAPDLLGPACAPLGPPADPAAVRPEGRAAVRRGHARALPQPHRRLHRSGSCRRGHRLRPADPGAGHRHHARRRDRPLRRVRRLGASGPRERPVRPGGRIQARMG